MNKLQFISLIITAASSFVLVVLAWMQSNVRMSRIENMLDNVVNRQVLDSKEIRDSFAADNKAIRDSFAADNKAIRDSFAADNKAIRDSVATDMKEIRERLATIDNHLMTFYTITGRLEGRIDEVSRR